MGDRGTQLSIDQMSITPPVESLISPTLRFLLTIREASVNAKASNTGAAVLNSGLKYPTGRPRNASSAASAIKSAELPHRLPARSAARRRTSVIAFVLAATFRFVGVGMHREARHHRDIGVDRVTDRHALRLDAATVVVDPLLGLGRGDKGES